MMAGRSGSVRPLLLSLVLLSLLASGCFGGEPPADTPPAPDQRTDAASLRPVTESFSGTAMGNPAQPGVQEFPFQVPSGAVGLNGTLTWSSPAARFRLELLDPSGKVVETGRVESAGRMVLATVEPPKPGEYKYRVTAMVAVNVPFTLDVAADLIVPENNVDRRTMTLGAASFYEINLILEKDASFNVSFTASAPIKWDVHSHPEGRVKYWHQAEGTEGQLTFTAPSRGVYSVLFNNPGATDVQLQYEVMGRFRMHSHAG